MGKYIDGSGLTHFMGIIKGYFVPQTRKVNGHALSADVTVTASDIGVAAGAEVNQNAFSNVKVGSVTVAADSKTDTLELVPGSNVTLTPDATNDKVTIAATDTTYSNATTSAAGLMSADDKTKLNGIATGAEVNQNAFSNVLVGSTTVAADGKTDTLELVAGTNVTLTPDATNDKVTIASADTKNTAGSTDSSSKLFIVGATSQAANPQTYSQDTAYVGTDGHLYSDSKQVVNLSGSQALTNKTYNGYTLAAACAKGVDTSIAAGSTSANLPTSAAVVNYIGQVAGALVYKGAVNAESALLNTALKVGWFYIVGTAGSYGGNVCEAGDMIIVNTAGTYSNSTGLGAAIDVIQTNIETLSNAEIDALWAAA